jgi:hypothetical protein
MTNKILPSTIRCSRIRLQVRLCLHTRRLLVLALDHVFLRALHHLCELLTRLRVVLEEVVLYQTLRRLTHPLEEGEVLELVYH